MNRPRVNRRARQRLDTAELRDVWRGLGKLGIADRIQRVNEAVAPTAPLFWHLFKLRVAAREGQAPIRSETDLRELAEAVLRENGHDLTGVVLKVGWRPPVLTFEAVSEHGVTRDVVLHVKASPAGLARDRARRALR